MKKGYRTMISAKASDRLGESPHAGAECTLERQPGMV